MITTQSLVDMINTYDAHALEQELYGPNCLTTVRAVPSKRAYNRRPPKTAVQLISKYYPVEVKEISEATVNYNKRSPSFTLSPQALVMLSAIGSVMSAHISRPTLCKQLGISLNLLVKAERCRFTGAEYETVKRKVGNVVKSFYGEQV